MTTDPIQPFASNENGIIKNPKELLVIAEQKVGQLENRVRELEEQAKLGVETIDKLKWQNASLRVGITALGEHFNCPPVEAKKIYDAYCKKKETEVQKLADEAKAKFMQDLKDGRVPDLKAVDRQTGEVVDFKKGE